MSIIRYQSLSGRKPVSQKEYYEGYYDNKRILFDRVFRGYRFSDEECRALCQGEWLEVHNLQNGMVLYGVRGCLHQDIFASVNSDVPVYIFKVKTSLVNNPKYRFADRKPYYGPNKPEPVKDEIEPKKKTQFILHESSVDTFSDEEDSKMAARVAAATSLPDVVEVKTNENNIKIFVPVIAGYRYTDDGMELVKDDGVLPVNKNSDNQTVVFDDEQAIDESSVADVSMDVEDIIDDVVIDYESDVYDELFSDDDGINEQYVDEYGSDDVPFA